MPVNPVVINLATLDGSNGFRLDGIAARDRSGYCVSSAGDINGDGFSDLLIGSNGPDPNGNLYAGETYVVFGKADSFGPSFDLSALDGLNGFRLQGFDAYDLSGYFVASAGDVNGDGFDDILIGANSSAPDGKLYAGETSVVFGKSSGFAAVVDLSTLDGQSGFTLAGANEYDFSGRTVAGAGDVNGDGFDDILVGAFRADPGGDDAAGTSYIVFGKSGGFLPNEDLSQLDGSNGFCLEGINANDYSGFALSTAGDFNGDGFDDIIIGAFKADPDGRTSAGEAYVVFGKQAPFAATLDLSTLDGLTGFCLKGAVAQDLSGHSVSTAGDINGDGFDDIIIGAIWAKPGGLTSAGSSFVVFGNQGGFAASLDLATLDGTNGFRIDGVAALDLSGASVSSAGDVNGDGTDDILIGAHGANNTAGATYVVFGKATGFSATFNLSTLNGNNGFCLAGIDFDDQSGYVASSAGDINADGYDDILIGATNGDPHSATDAGESYLVYGRATAAVRRQGTTIDDRLFGGDFNDTLRGMGGKDQLFGGDGRDILVGDMHSDVLQGGLASDRFKFASGDSGQRLANMDIISDFTKGAFNVGDRFDFSIALTTGGSGAAATATRASIDNTSGVASFAAGSGLTLADALLDITSRFTSATDSLGEFALFRIAGKGDHYIFVSDGVAGVSSDDLLVQLKDISNVTSISLAGGDLTILS